MKRLALTLLMLCVAFPAAAEVYRWTDAQGSVHYSDSPPPRSIKQMQRLDVPGSEGEQPAQDHPPVVLFTCNCGATCEQAADYLRQRGVPFSLRNADTDPAAAKELKQRTGALGVPVLFVGDSMQRGYSPTVWDKMLDVAGYAAPAKKPAQEETTGTEPQNNQ